MKKYYRRYYIVPRPLNRPVYVRSIGCFNLPAMRHEDTKTADFAEFFWCVDGAGFFRQDDQIIKVGKNMTMYYPPGSRHDYWAGREGFHYWWITLAGVNVSAFCNSLQLVPGRHESGSCPQSIFEDIERKIQLADAASQMDILASLFRIITMIEIPDISTVCNDNISRAHEMIDLGFTDPGLNVEQIAFKLDMSRVVLSREFSKRYRIGISEYLRSVRLRYAIELLKAGELSIGEIAEKSGFNSAGYFSRVIMQSTGLTPTRLRSGSLEK